MLHNIYLTELRNKGKLKIAQDKNRMYSKTTQNEGSRTGSPAWLKTERKKKGLRRDLHFADAKLGKIRNGKKGKERKKRGNETFRA
jgi:hypothetical protein